MKPKINFFCIGAQKAGTTTLFDILSKHKEVFMPERKETHFFNLDNFYNNGIDWYLNNYFTLTDEYKIVGEITPDYLYFPDVPERIYRAFGEDIKFIVVLRNPVDRAYSHYLMNLSKGKEHLSFNEAVDKENSRINKSTSQLDLINYSYISKGYYCKQIKRYLEYFSIDNFLFLSFEKDIITNQINSTQLICDFLGIDNKIVAKKDIKAHETKSPKYFFIQYFINSISENTLVRSFIPQRLGKRVKKYIYKKNLTELKTSIDTVSKKKYFKKYYSKEILGLKNLINKDFSYWNI